MAVLFEVERVTFTHPNAGQANRPAVEDVSLRIEEGEFVALVGANGSGKTTLVRHLNALYIPDAGQVKVHGFDTRLPANRHQIQSLVGMVFQRPEDQMVATIVEEDVAFGPENLRLPGDEVRARVEEALNAVGMWEHRMRPPHLLSAGQMQRVALAGTLAMRPRCIIFDETTAMLDPQGRRKVMARMQNLHAEGYTVVFITHFMEEAAQAGRILVMNAGHLVADGTPRQVFSRPELSTQWGLELPPAAALARRLSGLVGGLPELPLSMDELLSALPPAPAGSQAGLEAGVRPPLSGEPIIDVRGLGYIYGRGTPLAQPALRHVDFSLYSGESHGVIGATGSGKSTLLQHLNGLLRPHSGSVRVLSYDLSDPAVSVSQLYRHIGLVFQDPDMQIFEQYVGDEVAFGPRHYLPRAELREQVRWAMELVGLDFERDKDRLTGALSGGERRKVALASALALKPEVLVLDEPTAGLDPQSHAAVVSRLQALKRGGMSLVISSHHMDDVATLSDRVTVMGDGSSRVSGGTRQVFAQAEALYGNGLDLPAAGQVAAQMVALGWPLPPGLVTEEALLEALAEAGKDGRHG